MFEIVRIVDLITYAWNKAHENEEKKEAKTKKKQKLNVKSALDWMIYASEFSVRSMCRCVFKSSGNSFNRAYFI